MRPNKLDRSRVQGHFALRGILVIALLLILVSALPAAAIRPCPMHGSEHQSPTPVAPRSADVLDGHDLESGEHGSAAGEHDQSFAVSNDHDGGEHSVPCDCLSTCLTCCTPALVTGYDVSLRVADIGAQRASSFMGRSSLRSTALLPPPARPPPSESHQF